ncbi:kinesin-like protein KIN-7O isoform X1 [Cinnamomum micranthum f. kanehirae]|uniref:Kinesin-like protein KIN-7O isoform X1 n=1 Tax=Cinnamomum micranthum f. kanehirae TaxID=337451 RepID=A0A443PKA2_9MAGN|nr:kinesin-like protein KIN-7O isoform X1 [Cinnamomum micranthum f. kanehirae]
MERIHVAVRARPLSPEDAKTSPWRISANSISLSNHSTKFDFDRIFGEECRTAQVYEARTRDIVAAAVRGFNGTVFAYGQTNSGKTHTMRGSTAEPGVIPLAVRDLFHIIQEDMDREFLLRMSYMEIYNEEINDLLAPEHRKLQVHESLERGIFVAGLREEIVASPEQVLDFMEFGESHRHIGETNMNVYSSRSHTIFRMIIESRDRTEDEDVGGSCDAVRVSVLNLVDLAGSERAAKTGAEGVRLKEGSHINKSLMTLGTVIKKLSEGAECQGGHVPYRDSKLTRILQPALGGNANTAIICNITLAQIHADETKSSLQFASRALRVTNCARVNEILTDAALLKRQKKEIEELRAKLLESHSEHFEEEILNLRNTLLQSELERERIALELQEEKKAHALREMRLQEQARRIENLSSLVLNSQRDESIHNKKNKRRDTWCLGATSGKSSVEVICTAQSIATVRKPVRTERDMGLPPPFEELIHQNEVKMGDSPSHLSENCGNHESLNDYALPDEHALLHVTNRRKVPLKRRNSLAENSDVLDMQAEYEDLLLKFETQGITKDIQIECLAKKLAEAECNPERTTSTSTCHLSECVSRGGKALTSRESEAILVIKQLQDQIKELETEKSSIQGNLDNVVQLATKQNSSSRVKYDQLHQELLDAREEARVAGDEARAAREQLCSLTSLGMLEEVKVDPLDKLSAEFHELELEVQNSKNTVKTFSSVAADLFQSYSFFSNSILDLKSFASQNIFQLKSIIRSHEKLHNCMEGKVVELEKDKVILYDQSFDQQKQIEDLKSNLQISEKALTELQQQRDLEKDDLITEIQDLQKEISFLSSSLVVKEREALRKELEKTKSKLKDTECKLKNAVQDKIRLESEKAYIEREIKHLRGQKTLLERDISKRESLADKRRESLADWRRESKDLSKAKVHNDLVEQTLQLKSIELERANFDFEILSGEYQKLEDHASEMEIKIASLEEDLLAANGEKEAALARNEILVSELEATSSKLETTNSELKTLQEEVSSLTLKLAESESLCQKLESSLGSMSREKEDMAMQLTDALLELEEERAVWSSKEKASVESIAEKVKMSNTEIALLSKDLLEVRHELDSCREQCRVLKERLTFSEENAERERKHSMEKTSEIDQLTNALRDCETKNAKLQDDAVMNNKEKAKSRMRLRMTQAKLDMHRCKYSEAVDEMEFMHRNYKDGIAKLKEKLASIASENLNLKKLLAAANK